MLSARLAASAAVAATAARAEAAAAADQRTVLFDMFHLRFGFSEGYGVSGALDLREQLAHALFRPPDDRLVRRHDERALQQLPVPHEQVDHLILGLRVGVREAEPGPEAVAADQIRDGILELRDDVAQ